MERRLWLLSDPLYLVEGNDRKTEQYARQVLVRMRRRSSRELAQPPDGFVLLLRSAAIAFRRDSDP